jgi:NTE family protein
MSRAVVLGGGGPVGIGWEAGLVLGLADGGVDLAQADLVVGTSAGSVVGAHLRLGTDLAVYAKGRTEAAARGDSDVPTTADVPPEQLLAFIEVVTEAFRATAHEPGRAVIGRYALEARTVVTPERLLSYFGELADRPWPAGFVCTTVEAATGRFVVWDATSGVDLQTAVASSCAVPGIFPPVEVAGRRYMDGGMRSGINADVAKGYDVALVVAVVGHVLPPGMSDARVELMRANQESELADLAASGTDLEVIGPDQELLDLTTWGLDLMDTAKAGAAFELGRRRGLAEAPRILEVWG